MPINDDTSDSDIIEMLRQQWEMEIVFNSKHGTPYEEREYMQRRMLSLAADGLKYRHVVEHDPVGLEEVEWMISQRLAKQTEVAQKGESND